MSPLRAGYRSIPPLRTPPRCSTPLKPCFAMFSLCSTTTSLVLLRFFLLVGWLIGWSIRVCLNDIVYRFVAWWCGLSYWALVLVFLNECWIDLGVYFVCFVYALLYVFCFVVSFLLTQESSHFLFNSNSHRSLRSLTLLAQSLLITIKNIIISTVRLRSLTLLRKVC